MKKINFEECLPYYSEYKRSYIFSDGKEMTYEEYWDWRNELRQKMEDNINKSNLEFKLKAIDSAEITDLLLNGYAPSIALKKFFNKNKI